MKRIAVLTSGGDCSGMNAAIRAVVRSGLSNNLEVIGIQKGYQGLIDQQYELLTTKSVSGKLQVGGTCLQSARCLEMHEESGLRRAVETLQEIGAEGLVVIGGDGSHRGAYELQKNGIPVIAILASIDNDIPFTDMSIRVDTALTNILHAVDSLTDTVSYHARSFFFDTMGAHSSYRPTAPAIAAPASAFPSSRASRSCLAAPSRSSRPQRRAQAQKCFCRSTKRRRSLFTRRHTR